MPTNDPRLDLPRHSSEHIRRCIMKLFRVFLLTIFFLHTLSPVPAQPQQDKTPATKPPRTVINVVMTVDCLA